MSILVTGGTGFIGRAVINRLVADHYPVVASVRGDSVSLPGTVKTYFQDDLSAHNNWQEVLGPQETVIHCAARAHVISEESRDPLAEFRKANVEGTLNLARQAAAAGVRRFIFISSIGVNGNSSERPFSELDEPKPQEPYAVSKLEAEIGLRHIAFESQMEVVIIRPPLVYGPNAPGNFGRLMRAVESGIPLPLGSIHNKRSLVALDNLVDLIVTCVAHPAAVNQILLVSDGEDLSTTGLLHRIGRAVGKPARLIPVPEGLVSFGAKLIGKENIAQRLCGSLQVDPQKTFDLLGWHPPVSVEQALHAAAQHSLKHQSR